MADATEKDAAAGAAASEPSPVDPGTAVVREPAKPEAATAAVAEPVKAEPAPAEAPAEASASPVVPDDAAAYEERSSVVEMEPVVLERPEKASQRPALHHHHPPPPPSIRGKGVTGRDKLEVVGEPKLAQDLMTRKIFTIGPEDILEQLEQHMLAFRIRHLPVVEDDLLVGMITYADLLHASASPLVEKAKELDAIIHKRPAKHIMRREFKTVRPTATLTEVAAVMWEERIGCVLVTDDHGKLLGIVTEADFLRLAHHFLTKAEGSPAAT
jgi:CBS domain-containing membrane protein